MKTACVLLLAMLATACSAGDKAGGSGPPVKLRIGTDDSPGRPVAAAIAEFVAQARALSGGRIRVTAVYHAAGLNIRAWDQRVARLVESGRLEGGMVPARAWDEEGVTTLRALQAPYLVTSDRLVARIVSGELAAPLLAGLDRAHVVGLGLVPEGLRHPFAFARPLLAPADFSGATIRVPRSRDAYALYRALGAVPDDPNGKAYIGAVRRGDVAGIDASFLVPPPGPRRPIATGNVTPYAKLDAIVLNRRTWDGLTEADRRTLREAARRTVAHMLRINPPDARGARRYCAAGGQVVLAPSAGVAALVAAARPVYAALERDAQTRALIARIRALAAQTPAGPPVAPCAPAERPDGRGSAAGADVLDGVWRANPTYEDGIRAGLPPDLAADQMGLETVRLDGGRYDRRWRSRTGDQRCPGTYAVSGNRVVFTDGDPCSGEWDVTFRVDGSTIHWGRVHVHTGDPTDGIVWGLLHARPWRRIDEPAFPDGVYRADVPPAFLVAHGADPDDAESDGGLQTMTFAAGRWVHHTDENALEPDDCTGRYSVAGGRLQVFADARDECGTAAGGLLFSADWALEGATLRLTAVQSGDGYPLEARALWGGKPWRKIG
jgi:TRAP-type C4-dicarboxylate transport system substrate-binding protein